MRLLAGREYVLAFDAWSTAPRTIEVKLGQDQSPWATYKVVNPSLTPTRRSFRYVFPMQHPTDLNARLMFNLGISPADVHLDNVAVFVMPLGDLDRDGSVGLNDLKSWTSQWLKTGGGLSGDLNGDGRVDFKDFVIFGESWSAEDRP